MSRSRFWCYTLNNYTEDDFLHLFQLQERGTLTYLVAGKEVGQNGTRHIQAYFELPTRKRLTQVTNLLGQRGHLESRRGTAAQARDYCTKDGDYREAGLISDTNQGERTDLQQLKSALDRGESILSISENYFGQYLRYHKTILSYRLLHSTKRNWKTEVKVFWGVTGTGKTRTVHETVQNDGETLYVHPGGSWFDGFDGQHNVLFDDYSGSCFPLPYLLKLLDRYPMSVPVKGGFTNWNPKRIYITSNIDPANWYPNAHDEHKRALRRRFSLVRHYLGMMMNGQDYNEEIVLPIP